MYSFVKWATRAEVVKVVLYLFPSGLAPHVSAEPFLADCHLLLSHVALPRPALETDPTTIQKIISKGTATSAFGFHHGKIIPIALQMSTLSHRLDPQEPPVQDHNDSAILIPISGRSEFGEVGEKQKTRRGAGSSVPT